MKLMAIDPGSKNVGVAIFEDEELVFCTRLNFESKQEKFNERLNDILCQLYIEFLRLAHYYRIDHIGWEVVPGIGGFGHHDFVVSVSAALKVIAIQFEVPWQGVAAITAKKTMTGNHKATKEQVRDRVYELYPDFKEAFPKVKYNQWDTFDAVIIGRTLMNKNNWHRFKTSAFTGVDW